MKYIQRLALLSLFYILITSFSYSAVNGLQARVSIVPGLSKDSTSQAYAQRVEMLDKVSEVLETVLYSKQGKEKALDEGRRIFKDYKNGTITVVDTKENQQKVTDYLDQLNTVVQENSNSTYVKPKSKIVVIRHADPNNLKNTLNQIIQESRAGSSAGGVTSGAGNYVTGVITPGAGNGLSFLNTTVELVDITGQDTANAQARLYIYTPNRDREVTLSRGNSDLVDNYRVRLVSVDPKKQEAEIEIRQVGNTTVP